MSSPGQEHSEHLPRRAVVYYGIGQASEGIKNYAFATFLLFYYTSVVGLPGSLAGAALMIALVFDAVTDPIVAAISDRTRSRYGRRHPYMFASAVPLGIFFYLTFAPPTALDTTLGIDREWALFLWLVSCAVLTRAAMTLFHVPHMALGAELTADFDERNRVVACRSLFSTLATGAAVTGYFILIDTMQTPEYADGRLNPLPYAVFAAAFGAVMTIAVIASAWGTMDRIPTLPAPDDEPSERGLLHTILDDLRGALSIPSFRVLFLGFALCYLAWGATTALGTHLALYFWHITIEQQGLYGVSLLVGILTGLAFWNRFAQRTDKKPAFLRGMVCFVTFSAGPPLAKVAGWFPAEGSAFYLPTFILVGFLGAFSISAAMVLVGSMMADVTDEDDLLHRRRREGIFFGALSFANKLSSGAGIVIAGLAYDAVGLYQGLDPKLASPEISTGLGLISGGITIALVGTSLAIFSRYDLTRERQAAIRLQLDQRGQPAGN